MNALITSSVRGSCITSAMFGWHGCSCSIMAWSGRNRAHFIAGNTIGYSGYKVGSRIHVLDSCALGKAILERLPIASGAWRIGP